MKTLQYIKSVLDEKEAAYLQVEANPETFDTPTKVYAKAQYEDAKKWYEEALKREENESKN